MKISDTVLEALSDLLLECTARITQLDGGLPAGSAFFVSDRLLVTNRHVVGPFVEGGTVLVHPHGREPCRGTMLPPSAADPKLDVALVRVDPDPAVPSVLLHRRLRSGRYCMAGCPREDFYTDLPAGMETREVRGYPRTENESAGPQLLRVTGEQIKPGWSGGPLLSFDTGA